MAKRKLLESIDEATPSADSLRRLGKQLKDAVGQQLAVVGEKVPVAVVLDLDEEMDVVLAGRVPFRTRLSRQLDVRIEKDLETVARIDRVLEIPISETLDVPLDMKLRIPLDSRVHIRETLHIDSKVEFTTTVMAMGVAPIPIEAKVPVRMQVPLDQEVHIKGEIEVPIKRVLQVPIQQVIRVPLKVSLPVTVDLDTDLPVAFDLDLDADVEIDQTLPVRLSKKLRLTGQKVSVVETSRTKEE